MDTAPPPVKAESATPPDGAQDSQPTLQVAPPVLVDEFKPVSYTHLTLPTTPYV